MENANGDRLLKVDEVMAVLGLRKSAVYQLVQAGRLRGVHPAMGGRGVRVRQRDLDAYIERLSAEPVGARR
jgi:excisionase family DNA binding protein